MGVYCHGGLPEGYIEYDVGGFAAYAWQGFECFAVIGYLALVLF